MNDEQYYILQISHLKEISNNAQKLQEYYERKLKAIREENKI